jgi:hypothetical protein
MSDYDMSIHSSTDAREWTDLFFKSHPNCNVDKETMYGWFVNAMIAMYDNKQNEQEPVAWMSTKGEGGLTDDSYYANHKDYVPLYLAPQKQEPLSNEEVLAKYKALQNMYYEPCYLAGFRDAEIEYGIAERMWIYEGL